MANSCVGFEGRFFDVYGASKNLTRSKDKTQTKIAMPHVIDLQGVIFCEPRRMATQFDF